MIDTPDLPSNIIFWLRLSVCMYVSGLFPDFSKTTKDNPKIPTPFVRC